MMRHPSRRTRSTSVDSLPVEDRAVFGLTEGKRFTSACEHFSRSPPSSKASPSALAPTPDPNPRRLLSSKQPRRSRDHWSILAPTYQHHYQIIGPPLTPAVRGVFYDHKLTLE